MNELVMYKTDWCPFCYRAEQLLRRKGIEQVTRINVGGDDTDGVRVVLFVDFLRPCRWPVIWLNRLLVFLARYSPLVQSAKKKPAELGAPVLRRAAAGTVAAGRRGRPRPTRLKPLPDHQPVRAVDCPPTDPPTGAKPASRLSCEVLIRMPGPTRAANCIEG